MQISINGPPFNLRLLHLFEDKRNAEFPQLNERRICNLHVVYNAFKIRGKSSNFDLENQNWRGLHLFQTSHENMIKAMICYASALIFL